VRDRGLGHKYFSAEKSFDPASRRRAPAFSSSSVAKATGAGLHTALELFESITNHYEAIEKWNLEMKEFLAKERTEPAFEVIL